MKEVTDTFIISKAGFKYIAILVLLVAVSFYLNLSLLRVLGLVALGFVVYIYRNPELEIPYMQKGALLAPIDGKIVAINTMDDNYELIIKSSLLDVSILRTPFFSTVNTVKLRRGMRLSTENKKSVLLNEKVDIIFEDRYNNLVLVEHMLENSIDDLTVNLHEGMELSQGKRYGVMTKGRTIIHLPLTARLSVQVDSQVKSGETLLGYLS
jgi:phosphatidylserine decarboxylase